jgi:ABC-type uncharacterized transport system permease subunit
LGSDKHELSVTLKVVIPVAIAVLLAVVIISVLLLVRGKNGPPDLFPYPRLEEKYQKILTAIFSEQQMALQRRI